MRYYISITDGSKMVDEAFNDAPSLISWLMAYEQSREDSEQDKWEAVDREDDIYKGQELINDGLAVQEK